QSSASATWTARRIRRARRALPDRSLNARSNPGFVAMPGLRLHLAIARDLAEGLKTPSLDAERGAFYLGATTPDIRALTRWDRERTHFFRLDDFGEQSGVHR